MTIRAIPRITELVSTSLPRAQVADAIDEYSSFHAGTVETRKDNYVRMVNDYYDLVTDFYEYGWGQSFHFAPRHRGESFAASLARHEFYLALKLGLRPGMKVLDVGCGVGGPMRAIARLSGAGVVGVNNNAYQIKRGQQQNADAGLADLCSFVKADFMSLPMPPRSFQAAYAVEATCHAPDKAALFAEILRVLEPGAEFAGYEWCLTDKYDPANAEHRAIKKGVEEGDALPDLATTGDVLAALEAAGFEVVESADLAPASDPETPWYLPLAGRMSVDGFRHTQAGRWLTNRVVGALETLRVAPKGSHAVSTMLNKAAVALVRGGETGVFTPMFYFRARKPT
jgi:sterol 24-C-methyltransferase